MKYHIIYDIPSIKELQSYGWNIQTPQDLIDILNTYEDYDLYYAFGEPKCFVEEEE